MASVGGCVVDLIQTSAGSRRRVLVLVKRKLCSAIRSRTSTVRASPILQKSRLGHEMVANKRLGKALSAQLTSTYRPRPRTARALSVLRRNQRRRGEGEAVCVGCVCLFLPAAVLVFFRSRRERASRLRRYDFVMKSIGRARPKS